jgi:hypothetical protein
MLAIGMGANCFAIIAGMITGQPFSSALPIGIALHFTTSVIVGVIFGLITSNVNKLRITRFAKGIGFGVAAGLIAFVILFLPIMLTAMPSKMIDLMKMMPMGGGGSSQMMSGSSGNSGAMMTGGSSSGNGGSDSSNSGMTEKSSAAMSGGMKSEMNNDQMIMMKNELPKMQSMIMAGSFLSHVVYGAALGSVVTILLTKTARTITTPKTKREI